MHVVIPAGGRGTRLRPLTNEIPKPLLPLGDRPVLTRIVERLPREVPVTVLVTAELYPAFSAWARTLPADRDVRVHAERVRADGQSGPLIALADCLADCAISEDLVLTMGDSLLPFTLEQFVEGAGDRLRLAAYELADIEDARRFGVVEIASDETVATFEEKPEHPRSPWIFTGCMRVPARLLPLVEPLARQKPMQMGNLVAGYLEAGETVEVFRAHGEWHDIGTVGSYIRAHGALLSESCRQSLMAQGNRLDGCVYVHPGATVRDSWLEDCVVLDGARISGSELRCCIVQPHGVVVDRHLRGALISPRDEISITEGLG